MGAKNNLSIGAALFGKTRRELLALLYTHPESSFYHRQIVRALSIGQGSVQRELARLAAAGLLARTRVGNQIHYQANQLSPVFSDLRALMVKSAGVADALRKALSPLSGALWIAFIHGSLARNAEAANSDVDVIVIGDVTFGEIVVALQSAQNTIGREVNPSVYSQRDFSSKLRNKNHFLTSVMEAPKLFLLGDEDELTRLAKRAVAVRA